MKQGLLIFLLICAMSAAMVARIPRAIKTENKPGICSKNSPCSWSIYKAGSPNEIELNITNSYCRCDTDTSCQFDEDDKSANSLVYRCRPVKSG